MLPELPSIIFLPVRVEPVNMIFAILSLATMWAPRSPALATVSRTPADSTVLITVLITLLSASPERVVYSEGLLTTVSPMRSAGIICHMAIIIGQFQGVIAPTTPNGR